jgi:hypothetical protein
MLLPLHPRPVVSVASSVVPGRAGLCGPCPDLVE